MHYSGCPKIRRVLTLFHVQLLYLISFVSLQGWASFPTITETMPSDRVVSSEHACDNVIFNVWMAVVRP